MSARRVIHGWVAAALVVGGLLVVACVGDPPLLGVYSARNCASCGDPNECVDLRLSRVHCGTCLNGCAGGEVCSNGQCQITCDAPFALCGGVCVDRDSDPSNCGACGVVCTSGACSGGKCGPGVCAAGTDNCDADNTNGCETSIAASVAHCGACNFVCAPPHAVPTCAAGKCSVASCDPGHLDCDGAPANGCEIDVSSDPTHCGNCATQCPQGNVCVNGVCTLGPQSTFPSPSILGDYIGVPRAISIALDTAASTTITYYKNAEVTPTTVASPVSLDTSALLANDGDTLTLRFRAATEPVQRLVVFKHDNAVRAADGFVIEDVNLTPPASPKQSVIAVAPGAIVSGTVLVQRWCPAGNCSVQIVYALDNVALGCLVTQSLGLVSGFPGRQDPGTLSVTAPSTLGIHRLRALFRKTSDCNGAVALGTAGAAFLEIGTVVVQ